VIEFVSALLVMQLASDSISQLPLKRLTDGRLSPMLTPQAFACRHLNLFFRTNWFFLRCGTFAGFQKPIAYHRGRILRLDRKASDSSRNSPARMQSGQSHLCRIITTHSVHSASGRSGRRADVYIASRCRIVAPGGTKQKLAKIEDATSDVSSD
jgi:hypothetical protein